MENQKLGSKFKLLSQLSKELEYISHELSAIHSIDNTSRIREIHYHVEDINSSLEGVQLNQINDQLLKLEEFLGTLLERPGVHDMDYLYQVNLIAKSISENLLLMMSLVENKATTSNLIKNLSYLNHSSENTELSQQLMVEKSVNENQLTIYRSSSEKLKKQFLTQYNSIGERKGRAGKYSPEKVLFDLVSESNKSKTEDGIFKACMEEFVNMHMEISSVPIENDFNSVVEYCNETARGLGKKFYILTEFQEIKAHASIAPEVVRYFRNQMLFIINSLPVNASCALEVKALNEKYSLIMDIKARFSVEGNFEAIDDQEISLEELKVLEKSLDVFKRLNRLDLNRLDCQVMIPLLPGIGEVFFVQTNGKEQLIPSFMVEKFISLNANDLNFSNKGTTCLLDGEVIDVFFQEDQEFDKDNLTGIVTYDQDFVKCVVLFDSIGEKEVVKIFGQDEDLYVKWGGDILPILNIAKKRVVENKVETLKTA